MQITHPCKKCITRSMCTLECQILTDYGDQLDFLNNEIGFYSLFAIACLFVGSLYYVLFSISIWAAFITIPFVWGASMLFNIYHRETISVEADSPQEHVMFVITLPAVSFILAVLIPLERYVDKYGPHSK